MSATQLVGPIALFMLMTIVGLELTLADFRRVFRAPRAVVGGTLGQWVLLPLMTWALVSALSLSPSLAAGAVLVAVSPGAGMSNIATAFARANVALSVSLTAMASLFAVVTLPLISSWMMNLFVGDVGGVQIPVAHLMRELFVSLLVPIALGMWIRSRNPARADALAPRLQRLVFLAIGILVGIAIALSPPAEADLFAGAERAVVGALLWTCAAGTIGFGLGTVLRLPPDDRFTFTIEFAARNIAVASIVAMSGLDRIDLTIFSVVYGALGYPLIFAAVIARRRWLASRPSAERGASSA